MPKDTFYDDFDGPDGSAPDPAKWVYDLGGGGWGNNELQTYTDSRLNSYQDGNSNLVIAATGLAVCTQVPPEDTGDVQSGRRQLRGPHKDQLPAWGVARVLAHGPGHHHGELAAVW